MRLRIKVNARLGDVENSLEFETQEVTKDEIEEVVGKVFKAVEKNKA